MIAFGKSPAQLLDYLEAHGFLPLDAVRLTEGRGVEPSVLRGEFARGLPRVPYVPAHRDQLGTKCPNGVENRHRCFGGRVHAHREPGCRTIGRERGTRVPRGWYHDAWNSQRLGTGDGRAHAARFERPGRIESFLLDPERAHSQRACHRVDRNERRRSLTQGDRRLVRRQRHPRRIAPHVPSVEKRLRTVGQMRVSDEVGLRALRTELRDRIPWRRRRARGAFE